MSQCCNALVSLQQDLKLPTTDTIPSLQASGDPNTGVSQSCSQSKMDDDSIDELAGTALLDHIVPEPPQTSTQWRHPSAEDPLKAKPSESNKSQNDGYCKPLPPVPDMHDDLDQYLQSSRPALASKTTNLRVAERGRGRGRPPKPKVSLPIPQASHPSSRPSTARSAQNAPSSQTSTAKAADLSHKISTLMQQAAAQEIETRKRAVAYADASEKPSPLQRGKKAFVKATRALKERLSSNSSSITKQRALVTQRSSPSSSNYENDPPPNYESEDEDRRGRLDRRIAEGTNLSNPKIQSLMGDGNIPRKPLPVYESMTSRIRRSDDATDPFSDGNEAKGRQGPKYSSSFDFSFDKRKNKTKHSQAEASSSNQIQSYDDPIPSSQHLMVPQNGATFSNKISGLAQHSDTTYFSSSPVAYSTPRVRLDPPPTIEGRDSRSALVRSPSILEFSFEGQSEDEHSTATSTDSRSATDGSLSVKRKNANEDLRSQAVPAIKRAKLSSRVSNEEANITNGFRLLGTQDYQASFPPKGKGTRIGRPVRKESKGKGLSIFDVGKGKAAETRENIESKLPRLRPTLNIRNSFARPGSGLFGRDSRTGMRRLEPTNDDSMDVDELQIDEFADRIRGN